MADDARLDMRMDKTSNFTAKDVVNEYSEEKLYNIINKYGEERFAKNIAKNICISRKEKQIEKTGELVEIIRKSIPSKFQDMRTSCKKDFSSDKN